MDKQQAVQEIVKLKKAYGTGGDDKAITQQAEAIRQQAGLDPNKYGSGVSLADVYLNYHQEFGQQSAPQQASQQDGFNQQQMLSDMQSMFKNNSDAYLAEQQANFERQLSQQIAQLEATYADAIAQGKMSVREAEQAFEAQKGEIEKTAFQQKQATDLMSGELGISNSMQSIGLKQADDSRVRSMNNANMSERDKRIADIKDRMTALQTQKGLAITNAQNEYGYNMASAQAQANQMYNQSMADLMGKNYFANLEQDFNKENMAIQQGYNRENMKAQYDFDISKMYVGRDINLEVMEKEMDKQLENQLKIIAKEHGYKMSEIGAQYSNQISAIKEQAKVQAQMANQEYQIALDRKARELGLNPDTATEYQIAQKLKEIGREDYLWEIQTKRDEGIKDAIINADITRTFQNPALENDPQYKQSYKDIYKGTPLEFLMGGTIGTINDALFGVNKNNEKADKEAEAKINALDAIIRKKESLGIDASLERGEKNKVLFDLLQER